MLLIDADRQMVLPTLAGVAALNRFRLDFPLRNPGVRLEDTGGLAPSATNQGYMCTARAVLVMQLFEVTIVLADD